MKSTKELRKGVAPRFESTRNLTPEVAAIFSKLLPAKDAQAGKPPTTAKGPNRSTLEDISSRVAGSITDSRAIFEILPDTELAMQVLVSSILSPKDMISTEIKFTSTQTGDMGEAVAAVIKIVSNHFQNKLPLKKRVTEMLNDALFKTGSYPIMVVPENTMDAVINSDNQVSKESISGFFNATGTIKTVGILGDPKDKDGKYKTANSEDAFSLESFGRRKRPATGLPYSGINAFTSVTDNINLVKLPMVIDKLTQDAIADKLDAAGISSVSKEGYRVDKKLTKEEQDLKSAYRPRQYRAENAVQLQTDETLGRGSVGNPLVMKLPSESVIPVHVPSDVSQHVGYFLLLDKNGNPISKAKDSKYFDVLRTKMSSDRVGISELLNRTKEAMYGDSTNSSKDTEGDMVRAYTEMVEGDLVKRLQHGVYGEGATLSCPEEVGRIMLARALSKKHTQMLFVPSELLTYIAFSYNENGTGRSLLEGSKIIASLRAMMLFANTMASIKNSVGRTKVNVVLDPDDPDPTSTVEKILHDFTRNHQTAYPLGIMDPSDITGFLQRSSVDVNVEGNPAYPETKTSIEDFARNVQKVDTDLEENLRNRHFMAMGIAPETIDATLDVEFATNLVGSNLLLAKRVIIYQEAFCFFLADFVKKYTLNSGYLMEEIRDAVKGTPTGKKLAKKDEDLDGDGELDNIFTLTRKLVEGIIVSLPTPDTAKLSNQATSFQQFNDLIDEALKAYINPEMFDGMLGGSELEDGIEPTIAALKSYFQRQWLRKNNIMPELEGMVNTKDEVFGFDIETIHTEHTKAILESMTELLRKLRRTGRKTSKELADDEARDAEAAAVEEDRVAELEAQVAELQAKLGAAEPPKVDEEAPPSEEEVANPDGTVINDNKVDNEEDLPNNGFDVNIPES